MITGSIITAFIFGNMAALMTQINKKDAHFDDQLDMIQQTMTQLKLPEDIQESIMKYLHYTVESPDVQKDLDKFFSFLSPSLQTTILKYLHKQMVSNV